MKIRVITGIIATIIIISGCVSTDIARKAAQFNTFGFDLSLDGKHLEAIKMYSKAIDLDPENTYAYSNRGGSYSALGQFEKAVSDASKAVELTPENFTVYSSRGSIYASSGNYKKALPDYNKSLVLDPYNVNAYVNRGIVFVALGNIKKAIEDYTTSIAVHPSHGAYSNRARAFFKTGKNVKALFDHNMAVKLGPTSSYVYYERGKFYLTALYNFQKALDDFNATLEYEPGSGITNRYMGIVYADTGKYKKAVQSYDRAIDLAPWCIESYLLRYISSKRGHLDEGGVLIKTVSGHGKKTWIHPLAELYTGHISIKEYLTKANPGDPEKNIEELCHAYYYIAEYYLFNKNLVMAEKYFNECLNTNKFWLISHHMAKVGLVKLKKGVN